MVAAGGPAHSHTLNPSAKSNRIAAPVPTMRRGLNILVTGQALDFENAGVF